MANDYTAFTVSNEWKNGLSKIAEVNEKAAELVGQYGIGDDLDEDGSYDYEAGNLLANLPADVRYSEDIMEAYDAICELANAYAEFAD